MLVRRKLVCVMAALVILAPPLMACALPGVQMSDEDKACCRHMADQCGDSSMPASHSCCKKSASTQSGAFQIKQRDSLSLELDSPIFVAATFLPPANPITAMMEDNIFVFPESPPGHSSVLRI